MDRVVKPPRQRVIVGTKLLETVSRGFFVVTCTYQLPVIEAGQFGLTATIVGIASFFLGYERYIDVTRRAAGRSTQAVRRCFAETLRFFVLHAAWVLPTTAVLIAWAFDWTLWLIALFALIAISEHLANQAYHATLIDPSHYPLLALAAARSTALAIGASACAFLAPQQFALNTALFGWAAASLVFVVLASFVWALRPKQPISPDALAPLPAVAQYRVSRLHFLVGLVAVAALQADRVVVGGVLTEYDVGVYFRNFTLAGLALQLFSIISFSRTAPAIYLHVREGRQALARQRVRQEYWRFAVVLMGTAIICLGLDVIAPSKPLSALHIEPQFVVLMVGAVLLRAAADYQGLILLASGADLKVLFNQSRALAIGTLSLVVGALQFALPGAVMAALVTPCVYLILNRADARSLIRSM